MTLMKLAAGLFVTAAALFIPVSAVQAATAPTIPESVQPERPGLTYGYQSGSISVTASGTDGDELGNVSSNKDTVEADGTVIRRENNGIFQVMRDDGQTVVAFLSGKLRMNYIRIMPGDKVRLEFLPNTMRGRIIWRYKNT